MIGLLLCMQMNTEGSFLLHYVLLGHIYLCLLYEPCMSVAIELLVTVPTCLLDTYMKGDICYLVNLG